MCDESVMPVSELVNLGECVVIVVACCGSVVNIHKLWCVCESIMKDHDSLVKVPALGSESVCTCSQCV